MSLHSRNHSPIERILYIEDDKNTQELVVEMYRACMASFHGEVEFRVAESWDAGMEIIRSVKVNVVLLDLVLLPHSKDDTLKRLADAMHLPPVIVLTGDDSKGLREACISAGADDYMTKRDAGNHPKRLCEKSYHAHLRRRGTNGGTP